MDRRSFLKTAAATGVVAGIASSPAAWALAEPPFRWGVASGDPLADRVILWTRCDPRPGTSKVTWEIGTDPKLRRVLRRGTVTTSAATDHTVKVDVTGLRPSTTYWYRFTVSGKASPIGRTKTAPGATQVLDRIRIGLVSCSNWTGGYFSAYRHLANQPDIDLILHVGDYIYEYGNGADLYGPGPAIGRAHDPGVEMVTLDHYRRRHAQYKTDPDLRLLHQRLPFVVTWDDHESANDAWQGGAENHGDDDYQPEGDWQARRGAALKAYFEWMPVRPVSAGSTQLYRSFSYGSLADLIVLDLRQDRDEQVVFPAEVDRVDDPDRTITGRAQLDWVKSQLASSQARWKLVGNPVMITPVVFPPLPDVVGGLPAGQVRQALADLLDGTLPEAGLPYNVDQWDGYTADRRELLQHIVDEGIDGVAFCTGDIHSTWACDVPLDAGTYNPLDPSGALGGSPSVAVELVTTSITSDNLDDITGSPPRTTSLAVEGLFKTSNRHVKELEFDSHGFAVLDITNERIECEWTYITDREDPSATTVPGPIWKTDFGSNFVTPVRTKVI